MRSNGCLIIAVILLAACNSSVVTSTYQSIDNGVWNKDEVLEFTLQELDTVQNYHLFINLRNNNTYAYSNLFLIAAMTNPEGQVVKDTLEYAMALPDGSWLGKGTGSIKENKLWYKENIVFPIPGVYKIAISHAMRKNGNVSGIVGLEGITDVGIELTKTSP